MSLYDDIDRIELSKEERRKIQNRLTDFDTMGTMLKTCASPESVLKVMRVELEGKNRPSYKIRIYGRYRKILPLTDLPVLEQWSQDQWAKKNAK
jgi:hypothetical protein